MKHDNRRRVAASFATALIFVAQGANSQDTGDQVLPEVKVKAEVEQETATGPVHGYRAKRAATATKTDTPLSETPQAVTVVTRDQIIDQGATNLQDALNYAAGVRSDAYGLDSRTDSARIRGDYPDEYLDGLRKGFNWYTSSWRNEPYALERIEVLRGPSAMLFGQGTTGGIINMVSKRPQAEAAKEVGIQIGSWGRKQIQADLTGPLTEDGAWLYRLVALERHADTQVDHVPDDRTLIAPSLTWKPSAATSLTFQASFQQDKTGSTSQFFPWAGVITPNPNGPLPTNRFIGEPDWDRYNTDHRQFGWLFEHRLDEQWTVRQNVRYSLNEVNYQTLYGDSFTLPGGWAGDPVNQRLFGRFADATLTTARTLSADQNLEGKFVTGDVSHQVVAGVDFVNFQQSGKAAFDAPSYAPYFGGVPLIDAYNPVYGNFTPPPFGDMASQRIRQYGLYAQDQLKIAKHWIVVAGLRHDRATNTTEGIGTEHDSATSKRFGLMYAFDNGWTPYLSYAESFTPQASRNGQAFEPLRGEQWEAGVKYEPKAGGIAFNANVYDLLQRNGIVELAPNVFEQTAKTKNKGMEIEARGDLTPQIELIAHYNYSDFDEVIEAVPEHQAAVWGKYKFALAGTPGFAVGGGLRYMSSFHDGAAPTIPSLTLADLMLSWENEEWRAALNVNNVTDKVYVATCLSRGDCWWGARRNAVLSLTRRW